MLRFLRTLPQNPIYLREHGRWGQPNRFFSTLSRYSPFVLMGAFMVGICSTSYGLPFTIGLNEDLVGYWLMVCLPTFAVQIMLIGALVTVPTLTTPLVSTEMEQGTWEILRLTPQPMLDLLMAKMLGALARLKWLWVLLLIGTGLQAAGGVLGLLGIIAFIPDDFLQQFNLSAITILLSILLVTRPWAELAFASLLGLNISTIVRSTRLGLATCYIILFVTRTVNGNMVWSIIALLFIETLAFNEELIFAIMTLSPSLVYLLATAGLMLMLVWRAHRLTTMSDDN